MDGGRYDCMDARLHGWRRYDFRDEGGRAASGTAAENGVGNSRRGGTSPRMDEVERSRKPEPRAALGATAESNAGRTTTGK
jgi:hypothetical protein